MPHRLEEQALRNAKRVGCRTSADDVYEIEEFGWIHVGIRLDVSAALCTCWDLIPLPSDNSA